MWNAFYFPIYFRHVFDASDMHDPLSDSTLTVHSTAVGHTLSWSQDASVPWGAPLGRPYAQDASTPYTMESSYEALVECAACSSSSGGARQQVPFKPSFREVSCGVDHCLGVTAEGLLATWGGVGNLNLLRSSDNKAEAGPKPLPNLLAHGTVSQVTLLDAQQRNASSLELPECLRPYTRGP